MSLSRAGQLSPADFLVRFVGREEPLRGLLAGLAEGQAHLLLTGARGAGKSALLRRFQIAVSQDAALSARWWVLLLPEGLPGVTRAVELGEAALAALSDALDGEGNTEQARAIRAELASLPPEPEARLAVAVETLAGWSRLNARGLVLVVDSLDRVLARLLDPPDALAALLRDPARLRVVCAASSDELPGDPTGLVPLFQRVPLGALTEAEQRELGLRLAEVRGGEGLAAALADGSALDALHTWVGDGARGWVRLFESTLTEGWGPVDEVLARWLDRSSEANDLRLDSLAPQAQRVVVGLAEQGCPVTAARLALAVRLDVNAVSSQLSRLVRLGLVEALTLPRTGRSGFQIADRCFQAWLRLRLGGRVWGAEADLARFLGLLHGLTRTPGGAGIISDPDDPAGALLLRVGVRARRGNWEMAITDLRMGLAGITPWEPACFALVLDAVRALVAGGRALAALAALQEAGLGERWRPLAEALAAIQDAECLGALSPELRGAAQRLLPLLSPPQARAPNAVRSHSGGRRPRARWS